jgi:hypothetical protein
MHPDTLKKEISPQDLPSEVFWALTKNLDDYRPSTVFRYIQM